MPNVYVDKPTKIMLDEMKKEFDSQGLGKASFTVMLRNAVAEFKARHEVKVKKNE
jgi:hypothetical protein